MKKAKNEFEFSKDQEYYLERFLTALKEITFGGLMPSGLEAVVMALIGGDPRHESSIADTISSGSSQIVEALDRVTSALEEINENLEKITEK